MDLLDIFPEQHLHMSVSTRFWVSWLGCRAVAWAAALSGAMSGGVAFWTRWRRWLILALVSASILLPFLLVAWRDSALAPMLAHSARQQGSLPPPSAWSSAIPEFVLEDDEHVGVEALKASWAARTRATCRSLRDRSQLLENEHGVTFPQLRLFLTCHLPHPVMRADANMVEAWIQRHRDIVAAGKVRCLCVGRNQRKHRGDSQRDSCGTGPCCCVHLLASHLWRAGRPLEGAGYCLLDGVPH